VRSAARLVVILCALGSLAFTLFAGHHNRSILLVGMFAVWVVAPSVGILGVLRVAERRSTQAETIVQAMAFILSCAALVLYAAFALHPLAHNAAAPFLLVPVFLWVAIAGMFLYARGTGAPIAH
jgi:hypothetical protein